MCIFLVKTSLTGRYKPPYTKKSPVSGNTSEVELPSAGFVLSTLTVNEFSWPGFRSEDKPYRSIQTAVHKEVSRERQHVGSRASQCGLRVVHPHRKRILLAWLQIGRQALPVDTNRRTQRSLP